MTVEDAAGRHLSHVGVQQDLASMIGGHAVLLPDRRVGIRVAAAAAAAPDAPMSR